MAGQLLHVHVGIPKTGSSALQRFLLDNRDRLADSGVFLPRTGQRHDGPHHPLVRRLSGLAGTRAPKIEALAAEIRASGLPAALITSEYIVPLMRASLLGWSFRRLAGMGFRLRFHAFVRPQPDLLNSAYPELLRSTLAWRSFEDFVAERRRSPARAFQTLLAPLARHAEAPLTLHPYTAAARRTGIWWPFLAGLGIDEGDRRGWVLPGEVNRSMGPLATHAVGRLVRRIERRGLIRGFRNRQLLRDRIRAATLAFPAEPAPFCGLDAAMRDLLWSEAAEANEALARAHWGRSWDEVFSEERARPVVPNGYRAARASPAAAAAEEAMFEAAWRACRRAVRQYEERSPGRRLRDRVMDPVDRLKDITLRLGIAWG
jgi:hypothetical protein